MKPEEQRITIAEACGWTHFEPDTIQYTARRADGKWGEIPYYLNSLDAMHEAEKVLNDGQFEEFIYRLCAGEKWKRAELNILDAIFTAKASAAQRAEAFLKTLSLWKDDN